MKKTLSIILSLTILICAFAFPANAVERDFKFYDKFVEQFGYGFDDPFMGTDFAVYEEVCCHYPDGSDEPDWALIKADGGVHCEVLTYDVFFGRAFANNDIAAPFTYGYGIYDAETERFYDFNEIEDETRYPDLTEILDTYHVGVKLGEPQLGDDLLFLDEFMRKAKTYATGRSFTAQETVKSYDELYVHDVDGVVDWVLVKGEFWFRYPMGSFYETIGDRVFRSEEGLGEPFVHGYGVYHVASRQFYELRAYMAHNGKFPGLTAALDELNLGEKIGDVNSDGRVNICDVTEMQRCLAEYRDYPETDAVEAAGCKNYYNGEAVAYLSDVNRDRVRDVNDATQVQLKLAEMA